MKRQKGSSQSNVPLASEVSSNSSGKQKKISLALSSVAFLVLVILVVSYFNFTWKQQVAQQQQEGKPQDQKTTEDTGVTPTYVLSSQFANWDDVPVNITPQVAAYTVDADLGNVINAGNFTLSDDAKALLAKNAFAVVPAQGQEFYPLYESNRYGQVPSFVTTDSMLHSYHLMFDDMLKKLEETKLTAELKSLNAAMLADSITQYESLKGTEWENAAKRNVGFFAVGSKTLDASVQIPEVVKSEVTQELALIEAHAGVEKSPVMNIGAPTADTAGNLSPEYVNEDYSQYVPRGHYTKSDGLKAYFKAMMWYGRLSFRLKNADEVKSSLLISSALAGKGSNQASWDKIYEPINFFVGKSDDITYYQYRDVMKGVYGDDISIAALTADAGKLQSFITKAKELDVPQVNSMPIFQADVSADRNAEIQAFRFLGQRFTIDASIFQRLMYREVGDKKTSCKDFDPKKTDCLSGARCLPSSLDVTAAMGSTEAYNILKAQGETDYACYDENLSKMKTHIAGLDKSIWTQNLYWGWLYSLKPLTEVKGEGYPSFMTNTAWQRKGLNTYLGSWTELKRDTILYTKQAYAEMGGGGDPVDDRGYVEPEPYVYARLASLIKMTKTGLDGRGFLDDEDKANFDNLEELAVQLKTISEKELNGTALTDKEYEFIKAYGGNIEHIWYNVFKSADGTAALDENSNSPVVADVATDPNGSALEEATGYVSEIYAVVPIDGKLRIAKGAVYSHYEFVQPISDRLTDEAWKAKLKNGTAPAMPTWTQAFISK